MSNLLKTFILGFFVCLFLVPPAYANQFDNEGNFCRIHIKNHELMISSYQPETSGGEIYCSNLPALSKSVIVFDLVNEKLRKTPLGIKLIALSGDQSQAEEYHGKMVATIPLGQHVSGSVQLTFTPEKSKQYAALITIHEGDQPESIAFPITVAKPQFAIAPSTLTATALSLMTLGVLFIFVRPLITKILNKRGGSQEKSE